MKTAQTITIDIETLPTALPFEAKAGWETEEEYESTSLDGNFGRVLCIGYARDFSDERPLEYGCFGWDEKASRFAADESTALTEFWEMMKQFDTRHDRIVGHNILEFDLPFIIKRSIINGIKPTVRLSLARYRNRPVFDTMREWDCWSFRNWTSLEKLALALGLASPKKNGICGGNLHSAFLEGRYREIYEYCLRDVKTARNAYRKMNFTYPSPLTQPAIPHEQFQEHVPAVRAN